MLVDSRRKLLSNIAASKQGKGLPIILAQEPLSTAYRVVKLF